MSGNRKWYFVCTHLNIFGKCLEKTTKYEEISLKAITEDEAISEAKEIWEKKVARIFKFWGQQKKESVTSMISMFKNEPHMPHVIYKIPLYKKGGGNC